MRGKLATGLGLITAVVAFAGLFLLTGSILWSVVVGLVGALGVYLVVDSRTPNEVANDTYAEDADRKVEEALRVVREIKRLTKDVGSPSARSQLDLASTTVPELLSRVKAGSPDSLYSSAAQLGAHLSSLRGVVEQYLDIQAKPTFYRDPTALLANGEEAFRRFAEFAVESVHLVNQGNVAAYRANLETVAPPKLPALGEE